MIGKNDELVVFRSSDEVIITLVGVAECEMLRQYFGPDSGRDLDDYEREEAPDDAVAVAFSSRIEES